MNALWAFAVLIVPQSTPDSTLEKIEREIIAVVEKVRPSVVQITARIGDEEFQSRFGESRTIRSSGFVVSADGIILTDLGGIEAARSILVTLQDGRRFQVQSSTVDRATAVAILRIKANGLKPAEFAEPESIRQGSIAVLISNPVGLSHSSAVGFVSGLNRSIVVEGRRYDDMLQTSAAVQSGDGGGLLSNARGQVVGMIHSRYVAEGLEPDPAGFVRPIPRDGLDFLPSGGPAVGFATPATTLRFVADRLMKHGRVVRGWAGLGLRRTLSSVEVVEVAPEGPAWKAGLRKGDLVLEFDGQAVGDLVSIRRRVVESDLPRTLRVRIQRGSGQLDVNLALAAEPGP